MEQITLRTPTELLDRIDETADEHDKSRSEYVRNLLETHTGHDEMQVTPERVRELADGEPLYRMNLVDVSDESS